MLIWLLRQLGARFSWRAAVTTAMPATSAISLFRDAASGAEIDLKMTRQRFPTIGSLIGDSTLAETYYYQDQTSPSVLKGLAANRSRLRWALVAQHFPRTASASNDNSLSVPWGIAPRARGRVRVIIQSFSS